MKNRTKKIIAIGSGICVFALWLAFLLFITRPYTEKIVIWLPDNYELENNVKNEIISIMPTPIDEPHQSNEVFCSQIDMDSFKKLFGKNQEVAVKIQDTSLLGEGWYKIVYQKEFDCADKSFIVSAQEEYCYNKRALSEMRLRDRELFLKNKRDTCSMYFFSMIGFVVIAFIVFLYTDGLNIWSKRSNN